MPNNIKIKEVSERTGISVKELNRLDQDLWYHGTTIEDAENIKENGVSVTYNHGASLDFGPGFYLTDTFQRAANYISRVPIIISGGKLEECKSWAVVEFGINPHNCDIIWGVMSDSNPEQIVWDYQNRIISFEEAVQLLQKSNSMKQLFIGNQKICDMLMINNIYVKEGNEDARRIND